MRKYILIPEYRPLYAMRRCFGPTNGPLTRPTLTPVDVIGSLLKQTGKEQLSIYEVKVLPNGKTTPPVRLTLTNYTLPYEEIAENPQVPGQTLIDVKPPKPVKPTPPPPKPPVETPTEPEESTEKAEDAVDDSHLQGETVVIVKPEEPAVSTADTIEEAAQVTEAAESVSEEVKSATVTEEVPVETEAAPADVTNDIVEVSDTVETTAESEIVAEESAETTETTEVDSVEIPPADPNDPVIQSGPYAGLTKAQKSAMKAAAKSRKSN